MAGGPYMIRTRGTGAGYRTSALTVPQAIADHVPAEALFAPELTDDGILYRFVGRKTDPSRVPDWAKGGDE